MIDTHPRDAAAQMARRDLLTTVANPGGPTDYVVRLSGRVAPANGRVLATITLRYVPDKLILTPDGFHRYMDNLGGVEWSSLEALAVTIVEDLKNELVARWAQILAAKPDDPDIDVQGHAILIEDKQPRWDNPTLISRTGGF